MTDIDDKLLEQQEQEQEEQGQEQDQDQEQKIQVHCLKQAAMAKQANKNNQRVRVSM
jgi:hypothetical protein